MIYYIAIENPLVHNKRQTHKIVIIRLQMRRVSNCNMVNDGTLQAKNATK